MEDNSAVGLAPMLKVSNHYSEYGLLSRRRIQAFDGLYPHFRTLLCRYIWGCDHMCLAISREFS